MNTLKLGCIGTGNICRHGHLPQFALLSGLEVTAFYDKDMEAARYAREIYLSLLEKTGRQIIPDMVSVCGTAEELFEKVDAVDICTSLRYHAYYAAMALDRGISAMSEKPMARTWLEGNRVAKSAAASKGFYQLNDDNLFIPRFLTAKALVDGGWIGDVLSMRIARGSPSSDRAEWFYDPMEGGGGAIQDYGSHAVAGAWSIIGFDKQPEIVRSMGIFTREKTRVVNGRMRNINIDDDAHFKVLFRDPVSRDWIDVSIEATWTHQHFGLGSSDVDGYLEIEGSLGRLSSYKDDEGSDYIKITSRTLGERLIPVKSVGSEEYSFSSEFSNFLNSVNAGIVPFLSADTGALTIAVINAAQLSEQQGRIAVEIAELRRFSERYLEKTADIWTASDKLILDLNRQFTRQL